MNIPKKGFLPNIVAWGYNLHFKKRKTWCAVKIPWIFNCEWMRLQSFDIKKTKGWMLSFSFLSLFQVFLKGKKTENSASSRRSFLFLFFFSEEGLYLKGPLMSKSSILIHSSWRVRISFSSWNFPLFLPSELPKSLCSLSPFHGFFWRGKI